jgi:protein-S-isoprenylcysteine O-methyltransferase Ste14
MLLLMLAWGFYFLLHSLLAAGFVKHWFQIRFNVSPRHYRIVYNLFNLLTLPLLVGFHLQQPSAPLYTNTLALMIIAAVVASVGLGLMLKAGFSYNLPAFAGLKEDVRMPLQTTGLHKYVRHPLYAATLLFCVGVCMAFPTLKNIMVLGLMFLYIYVGSNIEEKKLVLAFGDTYKQYQRKVKRLIPGVL